MTTTSSRPQPEFSGCGRYHKDADASRRGAGESAANPGWIGHTGISFYEKLGFSLLIPGVPYLGIGKDSGAEIPAQQSKALDVPAGTTARACIMQLDDGFPKIDLTEYAKDSPQAAAVNDDLGIVRLCLGTQNLAQDYALLKSSGIEFLSEPTEGVGGLADIALCRDPDGILIELIELHLEKWGTT